MIKLFYFIAAALVFWALSGLTLIVQAVLWLTQGEWFAGRLGDVVLGMGVQEPTGWIGEGSVYGWLWSQPVWLISFAVGLALIEYTVASALQMRASRA